MTNGEVKVKDLNNQSFINTWKITESEKSIYAETLSVTYGICGHTDNFAFVKGFADYSKDHYTPRTLCSNCVNSKIVESNKQKK